MDEMETNNFKMDNGTEVIDQNIVLPALMSDADHVNMNMATLLAVPQLHISYHFDVIVM